MPLTLVLQTVNALVLSAAGAAGLAATRHPGGFPERYRLTWRIAALGFVLIGASAVLQNGHGAWAIVRGEGSRVWNGYLRWAPAWNHGREAMLFALALLLLGCTRPRWRARVDGRWAAPGVLLAACALGTALGWLEGSLDVVRHLGRVALLDAAGLLLLILAVAGAMLADVVDRLLIVALVAYSIPLPLNALWFAWMASHADGGWTPSPASMQVYRLVFDLVCAGVALQRLRMARRGAYVPGLLPSPVGVRPLIG